MQMQVVALRRYPVKSMGGESLSEVVVDQRGVDGDRWYAVEDESGHFASGKSTRRFRRRDQVFDYTATTSQTGEVIVAGPAGRWPVGNPVLDAELSTAMGQRVRVTPEGAVPHQDMGSVSIVGTATLDWCARRWGVDADARRLRANVVVASDEPFVEERWAGRSITVGDSVLDVSVRIPRCRMIDIDQDGATADGRWLKPLARERGMLLAMYADVAAIGEIRVGDPLTVA